MNTDSILSLPIDGTISVTPLLHTLVILSEEIVPCSE